MILNLTRIHPGPVEQSKGTVSLPVLHRSESVQCGSDRDRFRMGLSDARKVLEVAAGDGLKESFSHFGAMKPGLADVGCATGGAGADRGRLFRLGWPAEVDFAW